MVIEKSCDNIKRSMFLNRPFAISAKNQNFLMVPKISVPPVESWYCSTMIRTKKINQGDAKWMLITSWMFNAFISFQSRWRVLLKTSLFLKQLALIPCRSHLFVGTNWAHFFPWSHVTWWYLLYGDSFEKIDFGGTQKWMSIASAIIAFISNRVRWIQLLITSLFSCMLVLV